MSNAKIIGGFIGGFLFSLAGVGSANVIGSIAVATIGAIKREAGTPWAAFVAGWTTLVAYITAASFYQVARFDLHPAASSAWLMGMWSVFALVVLLLRRWERRRPEPASKPVRVEA